MDKRIRTPDPEIYPEPRKDNIYSGAEISAAITGAVKVSANLILPDEKLLLLLMTYGNQHIGHTATTPTSNNGYH